tara:strand:+ start:795 stop:1238 length:444 start_codon:yes stop_codon:yes gene_type:complete
MTITDNIPFVIGNILAKFRELDNPETVSRAAAIALMPELRHRIHVEGKKTDGSAIGTYSNSYLKLRQSKYNRTSDSTVIASLTRQLENGYTLKATEKGYTIGNASPYNDEKIQHLEEKYGAIWQLTEKERELTQIVANETTLLIMNK